MVVAGVEVEVDGLGGRAVVLATAVTATVVTVIGYRRSLDGVNAAVWMGWWLIMPVVCGAADGVRCRV